MRFYISSQEPSRFQAQHRVSNAEMALISILPMTCAIMSIIYHSWKLRAFHWNETMFSVCKNEKRLPFHPNPLLSHNQKQHPTSRMNSCLCACLVVMHKQEAPCTNGHAHYLPNIKISLLVPDNEIFDLIWKGAVRCKNGVEYITEYKLTLELEAMTTHTIRREQGRSKKKEDAWLREDPELKAGD